jgi:hypothetical protein
MTLITIVISLSYIFCGIFLTIICLPLLKGKVIFDSLYGVSIKKAFKSEENWYRLNKFGAEKFIPSSLFLIVLGFTSLLYPVTSMYSRFFVFVVVPLVAVTIPVIQIIDFIRTSNKK